MSTVRAKFRCHYKEETESGFTIKFSPVSSGSEENDRFYKYTPWGELVLGTVNKDAAVQFEVGKEYYLDLNAA